VPGSRPAALATDHSSAPAAAPASALAAARTPSVPLTPAVPLAVALPARTPARASGQGRRSRRGWLRLISPVALLLLWQLVSQEGLISAQKLPSPTHIWSTAVSLVTTNSPAYGTLQGAMLISLERVAIGFAIGGSIGLLLAVVAGLSGVGENGVDPLMQMLRTVPLFGLIPLFILWFGIGDTPKILLIAIVAAVPLYLNTFAGIRGVDARLGELGQVLHLRRRELITHIVLPGAMPQILVGLRQSLGVAWLSLVVAEQVNANSGLGFMISQATQFLRTDVIIVALLVYCILGLLTDSLVRLLERRALAWRRSFAVA
jgi:sulfonate transport system permease protein